MAMDKASQFKFEDSDIIYIPHHGIMYKITWKALKMSNLIKTFFEDIYFVDIQAGLGETKTDEYIINITETPEGIKKTITLVGDSYNNIEPMTFRFVIELISYYSIHGMFHDTEFKRIQDISLYFVFDVYKASNFFDIPELIIGFAKYIAENIKMDLLNLSEIPLRPELDQIYSRNLTNIN